MKWRVQFLLPSLAVSGGVVCVLRHAVGLQKRGHEVVVYTQSIWDKSVEELLPEDVRGVGVIPYSSTDPLPEADVQVATHYATVLQVARSPGRAHVHFVQHVEELFSVDAPDIGVVRAYIEMAYRMPLYRICNSTWAKNTLRRLYGYDSDIAFNGVDEPGVPVSRMPGRPVRIVSFVDNRKWKGTMDAFEACAMVRAIRPELDLEWHVFGRASLPSAEWIHEEGLVPHGSLREIYQIGDVFLFLSWAESYPLPPIEAMAAGCTLVTTPFGTEDYVRDGVNAVVVPPRAPWAAAEAILDVLTWSEDRIKGMRSAAVETARRHSWERATTMFESALARALQRPRRSWVEWENMVLERLGVPVITG